MLRIALFAIAAPLLNAQFTIQPSQSDEQSFHLKNGTLEAEAQTVEQLLEFAYHVQSGTVVGPSWFKQKTFDVHGSVPAGQKIRPGLQQALIEHFKLQVHKETRPMDVYILEATPKAAAKLAISNTADNDRMSHIRGTNLSSESIARYLSSWLEKPVIDETGLTGRYKVDITWDANSSANLIPAVERAGLRLHEDHRPIEVLTVTSDF